MSSSLLDPLTDSTRTVTARVEAWVRVGLASQPPGIVTADGRLDGAALDLLTTDPAQLPELVRSCYRDMVLTRRLDTEAMALQRQGELMLWSPSLGQEGAQIGAMHALRPTDTIFPTYREHGAAIVRDIPITDLMGLFRGINFGPWDTERHHVHLYTLVLAAQTLHATGYAMGIQRDRTDEVVLACIGDGATSQGDANEAFVWAAAQQAPVVFLVQNNQYAISVPVSSQSRHPLARRADGFGFPGLRVDGNDAVAMHEAMAAATAYARSGAGPVLIEAVTYRMGPHTNSDDPTRYRDRAEEDSWRARDPIDRLRTLLADRGWADDAWFDALTAASDALAVEIRETVLNLPDPHPDEIFEHVYPEQTDELRQQRRGAAAYRATFAD